MVIPKQTQAAILVEQRKPLEIAEIELPSALDVGQVLVEFAYSGVCGSQLGEIDGVKGPDRWLPHLLGHEASGHVVAVGLRVSQVKAGDAVVAHWRPSLGIQANTPKYHWAGQTVNAGWVTTFNRFAVISENRLTTIPSDTDLKTAALYGCAITTGFGTIDNVAKIRLGETVVVFGAGGIGLNLIQASSLAGAAAIVAVDRYENRLSIASDCGATHTINATSCDVWAAMSAVFPTVKPDVFIDNTGQPEVISQGYKMVGERGRVVLVGVPGADKTTTLHTLALHFGKQIIGTTGGEAEPQRDIPRYMGLARARGLELSRLVTEIAPLAQVNRLIDGMRSGRTAGRCLIDFSLAA
jgi:S-(hydroxymethyl)glutathione dehydrogenase/alcohol dehydrogenase